jgi:transposase
MTLNHRLTSWAILLSACVICGGLGWLAADRKNMVGELVRLSAENEQMRIADERMLRARTNYAKPGTTQEEVDWIVKIADDYGMSKEILYAFRRAENGGSFLILGAKKISPEIRLRYPPKWWQFAQGAKTWNKHLNKVAQADPYLRHRTLWSFAHQWNPKPDEWTESVLAYLNEARHKGLTVTEPPRKEAPPGAKADGGGRKPSKHSIKEKKK